MDVKVAKYVKVIMCLNILISSDGQVQLEEGGVRLSLTVVDTPGYGDRLDNSDCWEPALTYLHTQV